MLAAIENGTIKTKLQDLCVSRSTFKWGIPVDFDDKHVVYVWLDALNNYITGIGYDTENPSEQYKKLWPADVHVVGKDIVRFHTIYWPIFLMAMGEQLPKQVLGHPWLLQGGEKMSKSKGNVLYFDDLASIFGVDSVRYYVLREMPFLSDGTITWELLTEKNNADLSNVMGNLVRRTLAMSNQYFSGKVKNYNIADTIFIGMANDPSKTAAASLSFVLVFAMTCFGNLFGVGGGSLISRLLGERIPLNHKEYKAISIGELHMIDSGFFIIENENRKRGISGRDTMLGQIVKEDRDSFHNFCMDESDGLIVTLTLLP